MTKEMEIYQKHKDGVRYKDLCNEFGLSIQTISSCCMRIKYREMDNEDSLYSTLLAYSDTEINCTRVWNSLRRAGINTTDDLSRRTYDSLKGICGLGKMGLDVIERTGLIKE